MFKTASNCGTSGTADRAEARGATEEQRQTSSKADYSRNAPTLVGCTQDAPPAALPTGVRAFHTPAGARQQPYRASIAALFAKYCPDRLARLDALMAQFKGVDHAFFKQMCSKYGVASEERLQYLST